jgi:hypothetical protein
MTSGSDWLPPIDRPDRDRSESSPEQWVPAGVAGASPTAAPPEPAPAAREPVPAAPLAATAVRLVIVSAVFLLVAGSPLFMTRRTVCQVDGRPQTHWSIVAPFNASGPSGCENKLGGGVLLDEAGL